MNYSIVLCLFCDYYAAIGKRRMETGMEQLEFFSIPSPCVGVCESNQKGYCKGCLRSREERLHWLQFSDGQKQQVLRLCRLRRKKLQQLAAQAQQAGEDAVLPAQMDFPF